MFNPRASLTIKENTNADCILYRQKLGTKIRIHPDVELLGSEIILFTNYPKDGKLNSASYQPLKWFDRNSQILSCSDKSSVFVIDTDIYVEIQMNISGIFKFWFQYNEKDGTKADGEIYIQIEPVLYAGADGDRILIPLDAICCQTVISKHLGPIDTWCAKLQVAKETGYNMIHFTPIQQLGSSNSAYSIKDQLSVNSNFANNIHKNQSITFEDVRNVIKKCREEWKVLAIADVVLNHTAYDSDWLVEHPEASYNCANCPYLRPAFLLDAMLAKCEIDIINGMLVNTGVPRILENECHLLALKEQLLKVYLPQINLHELYQCNVISYVQKFSEHIHKYETKDINCFNESRFEEIKLIPDLGYRRLAATVDFNLALQIFNVRIPNCCDEQIRIGKCVNMFQDYLEKLNEEIRKEIQTYINYAIDNCLDGIRYERIQADGPRIRINDNKRRIFMQYFTQNGIRGKSLPEIEAAMYGMQGQNFMAHNGWIIGANDPLINFADKQPGYHNVYLTRELLAWGDNVKLRYGLEPSDSPFLWQHMQNYVEIIASIFDGIRLDNCHSTPIHVAEYLLNAARRVNPNLYVVAELFTNSNSKDNIFVNRLGIASLIREALAVSDSIGLSGLVHRYGGLPIGSFLQNTCRPLNVSIAHAIFMDCTHDNPSPIVKRSLYDVVANTAIVAMACCATGSNRGYDELVPHQIDVVNEQRNYQEWSTDVNLETGIIAVKKELNRLHQQLAREGFTEIFVDQLNTNIIAVTRHSPITHESIILISYTAFKYPLLNHAIELPPLYFEGKFERIILETEFYMEKDDVFNLLAEFTMDPVLINGIKHCKTILHQHIPLENSNVFHPQITIENNLNKLTFRKFKPGDVVAIKISQSFSIRRNLVDLDNFIDSLHLKTARIFQEFCNIVDQMDLIALNYILFVCNQEEEEMSGIGVYNVPGYGPLVYCGLQGFISVLTEISTNNNLGHPLCKNLREGNWMLDYIINRLLHNEYTKPLAQWLGKYFDLLKTLPRSLIPCKFEAVLSGVYNILVERVYSLMPEFISKGSSFTRSLALATLQFVNVCKTSNLPAFSPNLKSPKPPEFCATIAAGLPHFSTGFMRCWGRDTFIAIRGILYLTGRFAEARFIILGFAQCLRHGLIPNLLDSGKRPRYNCRDAVWWWLYSIKQYVEYATQGENILKDTVSRIFPKDDWDPQEPGKYDQTLIEVMHETLQVHFQGLEFRERYAGTELDANITDEGFNNSIGVNLVNGFVYGGNRFNCGTWMDKMGSSSKAKNNGIPSTPRDGTAVELVGLQYAVLRFMNWTYDKGWNPYNCVTHNHSNGQQTAWTYSEWSDRIMNNFENFFYISDKTESSLVDKRYIYKDSYGATIDWTDYQLRCNFLITMVVAPDIFDAEHAWTALEVVKKQLLGPLGIKTLDPNDWMYCGDYDNSNDSTDGRKAHGANYHQGPEWLWPMGYYLRARLIFAKKLGYLKETIEETWKILKAHVKEIQTSPWRGLPELTNANGAYCPNSCGTQAWSVATILETLYDLNTLQTEI